MVRFPADSPVSPTKQPVLVDEPGRSRPHQVFIAHIGGKFNLGPAKNDHDPVNGPTTAVQPDYDAVDDAHLPGCLFFELAQRPATILDSLQLNWYSRTIFYCRMGTPLPIVSQDYPCSGANQAEPGWPRHYF